MTRIEREMLRQVNEEQSAARGLSVPVRLRAAAMAALLTLAFAGESAAQSPARSFDELRWALSTGERVLLVDEHGRRALGDVVSLGRTAIEIEVRRQGRWRVFGGDDPRFVFREDSVRWIEKDDSTFNGKLIGFGVGLAAALLAVRSENSGAAHAAFLLPAIGMAAGRSIDEQHRRLLYLSPTAPGTSGPGLGLHIGRTLRF